MAAAWRVAPLALAEVCVGLRTASQQQLYTVADNCTIVGPHSRAELAPGWESESPSRDLFDQQHTSDTPPNA